MEWSTIILVAVVVGFFLWRHERARVKGEERAVVATARLAKDQKLYDHIKAGMLEYEFRNRGNEFWKAKGRQLLFETAQFSCFHVDHFAESRVGFYFKDLKEFGLYGFFVGNDPEVDVFHSYYRTDETFQDEGQLLYEDD